MENSNMLPINKLEGAILNLDGVILDSTAFHAKAWKRLFDEFLKPYDHQPPFDMLSDYSRSVAGRSRYEAVSSFLQSRHIELPYGSPCDDENQKTICGLGNHKDKVVQRLLKTDKPAPFPHALDFLKKIRKKRFKIAVTTAETNGRLIINRLGLGALVDLVVDGDGAQQAGLEDKPAPDIFLMAASMLPVSPDRSMVVDASPSGIEAGREGGFAWVIGFSTNAEADLLQAVGADVVTERLGDLVTDGEEALSKSLPSALDRVADMVAGVPPDSIVVFLDFDGTLAPIVERPEAATIDDDTRSCLAALFKKKATVAIISGRDLDDVRQRVGLDNLIYAGSHGFDIAGGEKRQFSHQVGADHLPRIQKANEMLSAQLSDFPGIFLERKKFSIAVHYRQVARSDVDEIKRVVNGIADQFDDLRLTSGKEVLELQPDVAWHKGHAIQYLMDEVLDVAPGRHLVVYIGDDTTDEDAFRTLSEDGIGIVVDDTGERTTAATYRLNDPGQVRQFLWSLSAALEVRRGKDDWQLRYSGFDPTEQGLREALTTLGNGYVCTRGACVTAEADDIHYPGTYLAGGYNRLTTEIRGRLIENEDLVNMPNWLPLTFRVDDGPWIAVGEETVFDYEHILNLRSGVLIRRFRHCDAERRVTKVTERRWVHMERPHLAGIELIVTPENWSGRIEFRSGIDGGIVNGGVPRYSGLNNRHLLPCLMREVDSDTLVLQTRTSQSDLEIAAAARTQLFRERHDAPLPADKQVALEPDSISHLCRLEAEKGSAIRVEKIVAVYTSRDSAISAPGLEASRTAAEADSFESLLKSQKLSWSYLWRRFEMDLEPADQKDGLHYKINMIVHLYIFHLLQTTSINILSQGLDVGVPSRGWHGEAYRGHVFWDELFIFPLINLRLPEITRSLLLYRYRRLPAARRSARLEGFRGALYPWQSGSSGREESQRLHLNPRSGRWLPDNSSLQRHVNIAIAYNLYHYYQVNKDMEFMAFYGAEMMLDIARLLASLAKFNESLQRYEILQVMGPDEYHDAYPEADAPGIDNNAYTNLMTVWVLQRALDLLDEIPIDVREQVCEKLEISRDELAHWEDICTKMRVVFHDDNTIISQFEGYDALEEFDWQKYRNKYGDIQRLDRILEGEGDTPNRYKVSKQADVLMLFYLLSAEELSDIFEKLGYPFTYETIPGNIDYYLKRTSHGSTLSNVVHAWVLSRSDRARSWKLFGKALLSDFADIQKGTTPEGIHLGAMAGTVDQLQRGYTGIVTRGDVLWFNPCLPEELGGMTLTLRYRGHTLRIRINHEEIAIDAIHAAEHPIQIGFRDNIHSLAGGETIKLSLEAVPN